MTKNDMVDIWFRRIEQLFWLQASTAEIWSLTRELCLSNYFGAWWWLWEGKKKKETNILKVSR